jgi:hypothetical protein
MSMHMSFSSCRAALPGAIVVALGVALSACGGSGSLPSGATGAPAGAPPAAATPAPAPTPVPLSASETARVDATLAAATQQIMQAIIDQVTGARVPGAVRATASIPWNRQAEVSTICTSGGAFFGGSGRFDDESGFVDGQGTLQMKQCGNGDGTVSDGSLMVQGVGTVPGRVTGTVTGNLGIYRVQPSGGLSLVTSSYGVMRNWSCNVNANGRANCS